MSESPVHVLLVEVQYNFRVDLVQFLIDQLIWDDRRLRCS